MAYRRTEKVAQRLAARREAIIHAAQSIAAETGVAGLHVAAVAARAGIAAGTVYRYFPSKTELVNVVVAAVCSRELAAMRAAADAAPGPLSALAAAIATLAARAWLRRRLAWAVIAEPTDADIDAARLACRAALAGEIEARLQAAMRQGHLPDQDARAAAVATVGALLEGLIGPMAPMVDPAKGREQVQALTLFVLRAVGLLDARARGIVAQTPLPALDDHPVGTD